MNTNKNLVAEHSHTEYSLLDGVSSVKSMVEAAIKLGYKAFTITDHGTVLGWKDLEAVEKELSETNPEFKAIYGVEAYVTDKGLPDRRHLVLLSTDMESKKAISLAVTESNNNVVSIGKLSYPSMSKEILKKYLKGKNVKATSACMNGVISALLLKNYSINKKIKKIEVQLDKLPNPKNEIYVMIRKSQEEVNEKIKVLTQEMIELKKWEGKKPGPRLRGIKKYELIENPSAEDLAKIETFKKEIELIQNTEDKLPQIKTLLTGLISDKKILKEKEETEAKKFTKYNALTEKINELEKSLVSEDDILAMAEKELRFYIDLFGKNNFYLEMQYHGIEEEKVLAPILVSLSKKYDLKMIPANDAHMADQSEAEKFMYLRSLRFNKFEPLTDESRQEYLKSPEELRAALIQVYDEKEVDQAFDNLSEIYDAVNYVIVDEKHYPQYISDIKGETANESLERLTWAGVKKRYPNATQKQIDKIKYELSVIESMGFADYHLIVQDYINVGRLMGYLNPTDFEEFKEKMYDVNFTVADMFKFFETHEKVNGESIGPGRGSAAGSAVCYVLGITNIDPFKYDLMFERFLNPERVSMPDIDTDFAPNIKPLITEYVRKRYGYDKVCLINTLGTMAAKKSLKDMARIIGSKYSMNAKDDEEEEKIRQEFLEYGKELSAVVPKEPTITLKDVLPALRDKANTPAKKEILEAALLTEGSITQIGIHAGGVVISDKEAIKNHISLMFDTRNKVWKCQCDMVQVEESGLLKMDVRIVR